MKYYSFTIRNTTGGRRGPWGPFTTEAEAQWRAHKECTTGEKVDVVEMEVDIERLKLYVWGKWHHEGVSYPKIASELNNTYKWSIHYAVNFVKKVIKTYRPNGIELLRLKAKELGYKDPV